jgi:hypothetical protein
MMPGLSVTGGGGISAGRVTAGSFYITDNAPAFAYTSGSSGDTNVFFGFAGQNTSQSFNATIQDNTAVGYQALNNNGTGATSGFVADGNTAIGTAALFDNTLGNDNSATGYDALYSNTTGYYNTANGNSALFNNTTGSNNTAVGYQSLSSLGSTSGTAGSYNIAIGYEAGSYYYTGNEGFNIDIGALGTQGESNAIHIGQSQVATYIAGIYNVQTSSTTGSPVYVSSTGQLGTVLSSQRFKDNIVDMGDESDLLMKLRPVAFYYRPELDATHTRQYGLVAEEVAQVAPQLVVFDKDGTPQTVRYHFVNAMLLNEVQKQRQLIEQQQKANEDQQSTIARQQAEIQDLADRLTKLEARLGPAQ